MATQKRPKPAAKSRARSGRKKTPRKTPPVTRSGLEALASALGGRRRPRTRQEPQPHGGSLSRNTFPEDPPERDPAKPTEIHPLLARAGLVPGNPGNSGGKAGRSGRKPNAYYELLEDLLHDKESVEALRAVLRFPWSPNWGTVWKEIMNRLHGKPVQPHEHAGKIDHVIIMDA